MPTARTRGADALVRTLAGQGVKRLFTLSGNHIMPVFDACHSAGIELVHTRHEAAAVHMADAWARLSGEVGVALVTGGPGHANALGALYTAAMSDSPVLLLSGHAPLGQLGKGAFQEMHQAELAAPLCKGAWTASSAAALPAELLRAWRTAAGGRPGPAHLSLPSDVLDAEYTGPSEIGDASAPAQGLTLAQAETLIEILRAASRPLVLAGPQALTRSGRARLAALQSALGLPVVGMESPRGVRDPSLGAFAEVLADADLILLLGKRLDFTLGFGAAPGIHADARFVQVDADLAEIERSRRNVGARLLQAFQADLHPALDALLAAARPSIDHLDWLDRVQSALAWRLPQWTQVEASAQGLHPVQALRPLQAVLDSHPDSVLISDGGEIGQWAQACLRAPRRIINGVAGAIGSALPFAAAARLAEPVAPIVAVTGDGSFGFHCAEIDTAVRHGLHFVAVVGNDARWNAEHQIQLREYGAARTIGCELLPTRYDQVCAAFGGWGEQVQRADAVLPAVQRALASRLPACVNIMIDGRPAPEIRR